LESIEPERCSSDCSGEDLPPDSFETEARRDLESASSRKLSGHENIMEGMFYLLRLPMLRQALKACRELLPQCAER